MRNHLCWSKRTICGSGIKTEFKPQRFSIQAWETSQKKTQKNKTESFNFSLIELSVLPDTKQFLEHFLLPFIRAQQDTRPVWNSKEGNPVIKSQLPGELCLWLLAIKFLEASLEGDDWEGGNSWTTRQIAKSSISVSLPWHFNGRADLHFNESNWECSSKAEILRPKTGGKTRRFANTLSK